MVTMCLDEPIESRFRNDDPPRNQEGFSAAKSVRQARTLIRWIQRKDEETDVERGAFVDKYYFPS
jgi:hypothetical protein